MRHHDDSAARADLLRNKVKQRLVHAVSVL